MKPAKEGKKGEQKSRSSAQRGLLVAGGCALRQNAEDEALCGWELFFPLKEIQIIHPPPQPPINWQQMKKKAKTKTKLTPVTRI